ncbi:hypothetical protein WBG78_08325 [Chryseolinea sp. T2]|uniref:hypothetical protein n=1 Tax=Chryseolinea sp. T2 TaxID=3129255 RepID=UPI0030779B19
MFEPITSEIDLHTGQVLKEIATGTLFEVGVRMRDGSDKWEVREMEPENHARIIMVADRQTLAMKFFAEAED